MEKMWKFIKGLFIEKNTSHKFHLIYKYIPIDKTILEEEMLESTIIAKDIEAAKNLFVAKLRWMEFPIYVECMVGSKVSGITAPYGWKLLEKRTVEMDVYAKSIIHHIRLFNYLISPSANLTTYIEPEKRFEEEKKVNVIYKSDDKIVSETFKAMSMKEAKLLCKRYMLANKLNIEEYTYIQSSIVS